LGSKLQLTYWSCTKQNAATRTDGWEEMQENGSTAAACFPWKNSKGHEQDTQLHVFCSSSEACYNVVADNATPHCSLFIPDRLVTHSDYMSHVYMP